MRRIVSISFFLIFALLVQAQDALPQRFKAGVIAGFNTAQIDGDLSAGFNKFGLIGGLRGVAILSDKMELSLEMLYSQRGSKSDQDELGIPFKVSLNYIEVPVIFNYLDWLEGDGEYHKLHFHAGFSYGRLLNFNVDGGTSGFRELAGFFRDNDVSWLAGATFYANKHLGITARYSRSVFPLFERRDTPPVGETLIGYFFTFHTIYMF
ncbi:MAG: outer membrane beta-barrel protein [Bacteroidota bacterium]